jgi:putative flippase GtrA
MTESIGQLARYLCVGAVNSIVGLAFIYLAMAAGFGDVVSNAIGYTIGFGVSLVGNSRWTFRRTGLEARTALRFGIVMGVAYAANLLALLFSRDALLVGSHVAQLVGVATYTAVGFLGSRHFAFRS